MSRFSLFAVVFLASALASAAGPAAPAPSESSIAVMETVAQGASPAAAATVTEVMASYAADQLKLQVTTKKDFQERITFEQTRQLAGCETGSCAEAASVGNMLGVSRLVTASLGKLGDRLTLTVGVMDVKASTVGRRASRDLRSESELAENARDLIHYVLTGEQRESKGYARIESSVAGALVTVDGENVGITPLAAPLRLLAGRHSILVDKQGFIPLESSVVVEVGKEIVFEARLLPKDQVKVAGTSLLPWAGVTGGLAVAATTVSVFSFLKARGICREFGLGAPPAAGETVAPCYDNAIGTPELSKTELDAKRADVASWGAITELKDDTGAAQTKYGISFYTGVAAGVFGVASVALFTAFALSSAGAGGDAPSDAAVQIEPTADGFAVRF